MDKKYLIGLVMLGLLALVLLNGCTGLGLTCEDQSRDKLSTCNIDCGEGVMSSVCKSSCTAAHNDRLDACVAARQ